MFARLTKARVGGEGRSRISCWLEAGGREVEVEEFQEIEALLHNGAEWFLPVQCDGGIG